MSFSVRSDSPRRAAALALLACAALFGCVPAGAAPPVTDAARQTPACGNPAPPAPTIDPLIHAGETLLARQDPSGAIAVFGAATRLAPDAPLARTRLGGAYLLDRQYAAAIAQFQRSIIAAPRNPDAFVGLALAYLHQGRPHLARAALGEARALAPERAPDIDRVTGWIERRAADAAAPRLQARD